MELETFDGWTIDRRLKQLRKIRKSDDKILFVDFDSDLGQAIFEKKINRYSYFECMDNKYYAKQNNADKETILSIEYEQDRLNSEFEVIDALVKKLERELK